MSNITQSNIPYVVVGDGASLTAQLILPAIGYVAFPTSVSLVAAYDTAFTDVSSNIASLTLVGNLVNVVFNAGFSYALTIVINTAGFTAAPVPATSPYSVAAISSATSPIVVIAGVALQTVRIFRMFFVNSGGVPTNVTIGDTTPASFSGAFPLQPGGTFSCDGNGSPSFVSAVGQGIQLTLSANVQISGTVWYTQS